MRCALAICLIFGSFLASSRPVTAEDIVSFESRGNTIRGLLNKPSEAPRAVIILLAGGHGRLAIGADGTLSALSQNQLVRTRAQYLQFGLATLTLDLASDLHREHDDRLTYATRFVADAAVVIRAMRAIAEPVVVAGTSRGSLRAAMALSKSTGAERPDAVVFTSAYLMPNGDLPAIQTIVGSPETLPATLIVHHREDACPDTPPEAVAPFRAWAGSIVRVIWLEGGQGDGNPCQADSPHGFSGLDPVVVEVVSRWVLTLPPQKGMQP